jgi:hypothetical protein
MHEPLTRAPSPRQSASTIPQILASYTSMGPFLARLVTQSYLASPMFTVTLQRDTIDIGGNVGMLAIGELPVGVQNTSLTWALVTRYSPSAGGLTAPANSPDEVYPVTWEIPLDDVYLDGQKLPRSILSSANISLTALIDTVSDPLKPLPVPRRACSPSIVQGNSLIRGPSDVIQFIINLLGGTRNIPCASAHSLAFQIGGKMFPIDPRDFITQAFEDSVDECILNIAATDPPEVGGGYLYSWSLGDPFLKS